MIVFIPFFFGSFLIFSDFIFFSFEKYIALLQDTAVMTVEDLAMKHLNEDITKREFWEKGIALCLKDVTEFMELTAK